MVKFPQVWELDSFFQGGSSSSAFKATCSEVEAKIATFVTLLGDQKLSDAIPLLQEIGLTLREMDSFVCCLISQDVNDSEARILDPKMRTLTTAFANAMILFDESIKKLSDEAFTALVESHDEVAFALEERRTLSKEKLSSREEAFINDLALDGYHGWSQIWSTFIGEMTFPFRGEDLFFGQIENKMADPDRMVRKEAFESITSEFTRYQSFFAQTLNHLGGFRLQVYEKRGWDSFLQEAIEENRMEETTLNALFETIEKNRAPLLEYLKCKAALLGVDKISWYDLEAPLSSNSEEISYDDAAHFIIKQFNRFSPKMGAFAKQALESGWIEAEDRKGKSPGGFCTALPLKRESRIFMTFSKTMTNVFTLAHELGHAFHNLVIFPLPEMAQHCKMNVAETASTMAEMIVTRAAIDQESDPKLRLSLLDDHLSRATSYLMNIYARFLFEKAFYEERKGGFVSHERLSHLMEVAQRRAYGDALGTYHPLFWASKMHFYITDVPFYNFPYTFGYLFSLGIHTFAESDPNFEDSYISLLKDSGQMSVEQLAQIHLQVDLRTPDLWQQGLDVIKRDVEEFVKLSSLDKNPDS
ncbi:MAG: Oligoendopeptidase F, plasmid [Chlamydiae bacterium]|nr:Oligoendopeptidase F, plasmid [Chlamydiota bacterium]